MAIAREILDLYTQMTLDEKSSFFRRLADEFNVDPDEIQGAAQAFAEHHDAARLGQLIHAVEPRRQELFRRLNTAPGGTATIVGMREDLFGPLSEHPDLQLVEADLQHLLSSWFNRGFLQLERIDWNSPAAVLDRLIAHDSVQPVHGWEDLRRRLARDRRCFAFFHPALPRDPVIFVEVALVKGMASEVAPLLDRDGAPGDPNDADTAMFYSINNCHAGLKGISFGHFLIKQVVSELLRELPGLNTFATLSPVPGFRQWLTELQHAGGEGPLRAEDRAKLEALDDPGWLTNEKAAARLRPALLRLCAHYLINAKHGDSPIDAVARFHLRNGARLERLNWLADRSAQRLRESYGVMVNYVYDPATIVRNHEAYVRDHALVTGRKARALL